MQKVVFKMFFLFFLFSCAVSIAQQNSPWKKFLDETVNGVYLAPGCHEHSLTNGQGYSVYLKNNNSYPVNVTGSLIAKTTCGNEINSNFNVNLQPGEIAPGSDFFSGSKTGQTSVATALNCSGNRYAPNPAYLNRISNVRVWNVNVSPSGSGNPTPIPTPINTVAPKITQIPTSVAPAFDSVSYFRNIYTTAADSLNSQIYFLSARNSILNDSLNFYRNNFVKPVGIKNIAKVKQVVVAPKKVVEEKISKNYDGVKPIDILLNAGLGWDNLPIMINNDSTITSLPFRGASYSSTTSHPVLQLGLVAKLFNKAPVNLELNPFVSYGLNLLGGESGSHLTYGIGANILAAVTKSLPLKLVGIGNYTARNGDWNKTSESAEYNYNFIKYGGGVRYGLNENTWIQPTVTFDKLNADGAKAATVFGIESLIKNKFNVNLSYSSNYINQGVIKQFVTNLDNKGYFALRLLYNFGLIK